MNYCLERPINGQNSIVQYVYKHDQFTGTIQEMIKSNKIEEENRKKKTEQWTFKRFMIILLVPQMKCTEQPIIETKLSIHATFEATLNLYHDMKT